MAPMNSLVFAFVPVFGSIVLVWALSRLSVSAADEGRPALEIENGQLEFAPNRRNYVGVISLVALVGCKDHTAKNCANSGCTHKAN